MVGDHMQLPATVFSDKADYNKYNRSLFERLLENGFQKHTLTIQYRMHPTIREFIGATFYDNLLIDNEKSRFNILTHPYYTKISKIFCFTDLVKSKETFNEKSKSYTNYMEVEFIYTLVNQIQNKLSGIIHKDIKIAIISPYKAQVKMLIEKFSNNFKKSFLNLIEVNTVDAFQGREQDIVIISTVRSNVSEMSESSCNDVKGGFIGFLNDYRRMNVALSRAKLACYVLGNANTLRTNKYWNKLIDYCISIRSYYKKDNDYFS